MRQQKIFTAFGVTYRTKQFAAIEGLNLFGIQEEIDPVRMLANTEVKVGGSFIKMDRDAINAHVHDTVGVIRPLEALRGIVSLVYDHNFGFISHWQGVKVPTRFQTGSGSVNSKATDPMIATITGKDKASLRELEEYYSVEDAFKMFDMIVAAGVNEAKMHEEAAKARKK